MNNTALKKETFAEIDTDKLMIETEKLESILSDINLKIQNLSLQKRNVEYLLIKTMDDIKG